MLSVSGLNRTPYLPLLPWPERTNQEIATADLPIMRYLKPSRRKMTASLASSDDMV